MESPFETADAILINAARLEFVRAFLPRLISAAQLTSAFDVGCGALGVFSGALKEMGLKVQASDAREENVREASRRNPGIDFKVQDVEDRVLPDSPRSDLVLCFGLLYHLENPFRAVRNLAAVTTKCLLIETIVAPESQAACFLYDEAPAANQGMTYTALIATERALVKMLYRAGFQTVYGCSRPPRHQDFNASIQRRQIRRVLLACKADSPAIRAVSGAGGFRVLPEPQVRASDPDEWNRIPGHLLQSLKRPKWAAARCADAILRRVPSSWSERFFGSLARRSAPALDPGWVVGGHDSEKRPGALLRRLLWKRLPAGAQPVVDWWGSKVQLFRRSEICRELFLSGSYEPNEMMFLRQTLRPGMVFIDVGANLGLYTLFASRLVGSSGVVLALEPSGRDFNRLLANLQLNESAQVRALRLAASDHHSQRELLLADDEHSGHNTFGRFAYDSVGSNGWETVQTCPLDEVARQEHLGRVDVIKIDAEGHEWFVLQGARQIILKSHPVLLLEVNEKALAAQGCRPEQIIEFLKDLGYSLWQVDSSTGQPVPLSAGERANLNVIALPDADTKDSIASQNIPAKSDIGEAYV